MACCPADLGAELMALWKEFDERKTEDAKFAASIDRLQPFLHNYFTGGGTWLTPGVTISKVLEKQTRHDGSIATAIYTD